MKVKGIHRIQGLRGVILLFCLCCMISCNRDQQIIEPVPFIEIPNGFPSIPFPVDNAFTQKRWELGKKLFFDPILSKDSSISCGSCHAPSLAFADNKSFSPGIENRPGVRNAPSLANVAYHPYYLREGGLPTLEMQVLVPIQETNEFDHNIVDIAELLKNDDSYVALSKEAYNREPDAFVITRAISTFERSLISGNSAFDQWQNGNQNALSEGELRGKNLFFSDKTNCTTCHGGFNFTNYSFENNGLYLTYLDSGRIRFTKNESDRALFKVPSLRNVFLTAPYMHDGSFNTLIDVVNHYNSGGKNHKHKSSELGPLNLTDPEKNDLVAFLESLTDYSFIENNKWN